MGLVNRPAQAGVKVALVYANPIVACDDAVLLLGVVPMVSVTRATCLSISVLSIVWGELVMVLLLVSSEGESIAIVLIRSARRCPTFGVVGCCSVILV